MVSPKVKPITGELQNGKLWFSRRGDIMVIGLTSLGVNEVGFLESVEASEEGEAFDHGDIIVTLEGSVANLEVLAPASGAVYEVNEMAIEDPERISQDPLEEGWLLKLELDTQNESQDESKDESKDDEDGQDDEEEDEQQTQGEIL